MDKILSARVNETVLQKIGMLARQLRTTKKAIIEAAILAYAQKIETAEKTDVFAQTLGSWQRQEKPAQTRDEIRSKFNQGMKRHPS